MKVSQFPLFTVKETPADAEIISHQLMLRSGLMRKLASGFYIWLPLGLRVLRKIEAIVREQMNRAGGIEVLMPIVQPAELWQESARWQEYGPELLRFTDRHQREFCLGPTHEEIITDLVRHEVRSYKQLPVNFYQIQSKFRDEIRPRFGVMRAREFVMKDAYSFHLDQTSLQQTYDIMYQTYCNIFQALGLEFRAVQADSGNIGGAVSHEFHVLAETGEDAIAISNQSDYAANIELAEAVPLTSDQIPTETMTKVATPQQASIEAVCQFLKVKPNQCVKTLIVNGSQAEQPLVALLIRGDHELNHIKAEKHPLVAKPLSFADATKINQSLDGGVGYLGPVGLSLPIIADHSVLAMVDFVCGANQANYHLTGVNWGKDLAVPEAMDLRNVQAGDPSPDGQGELAIVRGIEVGHIFQLGEKYSQAMNATVLDQQGKAKVLTMGCYGIGISRIIGAAIEQGHDDAGIIWPTAIAPFQVVILPMNMAKSTIVATAVTKLYQQLLEVGIDVLLDDRNIRAGQMFADMDLIGIPHRLIMSERCLNSGNIEYKHRGSKDAELIAIEQLIEFLVAKL